MTAVMLGGNGGASADPRDDAAQVETTLVEDTMMIPKIGLTAIALGTSLAFSGTTAAAGELAGIWATSDGEAHVEFVSCDSGQCANIVWLQEPQSTIDGKPKRDRNNPDASLRGRPIMGLSILTEIQARPEGGWYAESYNPKDGETHDITLQQVDGGNLKLTGCALGGLICKSFIWRPVVAGAN